MSCSRTQHGDPSGARTPNLWIRGVNTRAPRSPQHEGTKKVLRGQHGDVIYTKAIGRSHDDYTASCYVNDVF